MGATACILCARDLERFDYYGIPTDESSAGYGASTLLSAFYTTGEELSD